MSKQVTQAVCVHMFVPGHLEKCYRSGCHQFAIVTCSSGGSELALAQDNGGVAATVVVGASDMVSHFWY